MSQYYQSNNPYNSAHQQKDGLTNGAIIGGLIGAAGAGGAHLLNRGSKEAIKMMRDERRDMIKNARILGEQGAYEANKDKLKTAFADNKETTSKLRKYEKRTNVFGGGWKGKALGYGGSVVAGGLAVAGIDALID